MSYATGYSYLFVRCKNAKQCEYLIEQFESENQNSNWFDLYQNDHSPLKIFFSLRDCDIPSDFDECGWPQKLDNLTWCKMPVN